MGVFRNRCPRTARLCLVLGCFNILHVINNLGTCYAKLQDYDKAIDYYQRALVIAPRFEKAIINLGAVYFQMGKYKLARETLLRGIKNNPQSKATAYLKMVENKPESIF